MTTLIDPNLNKNLRKILGPGIGSKKPLSTNDIRTSVLRGFPFSTFESVQKEMDLPQNQLSDLLGIPIRTIARRKESKYLTSIESDRLYRIARVLAFSADVLGDFEKARIWLKSPNRSLGGDIPLSLLDTDIGAEQVEDVLQRIKFGIYS